MILYDISGKALSTTVKYAITMMKITVLHNGTFTFIELPRTELKQLQ